MAIDFLNLSPGAAAAGSGAITGSEALSRSHPGQNSGADFGEMLSGFMGQVNSAQREADGMVEALALGEPVDIHRVMIALSEASNAMQLTMQVRNKVIEAYQELMKTPL